jgi:hypothetical protein
LCADNDLTAVVRRMSGRSFTIGYFWHSGRIAVVHDFSHSQQFSTFPVRGGPANECPRGSASRMPQLQGSL